MKARAQHMMLVGFFFFLGAGRDSLSTLGRRTGKLWFHEPTSLLLELMLVDESKLVEELLLGSEPYSVSGEL
ncbi:hypothetical protein O9929_01230 [Vibrio lentus]|nr:hypothetical protein [Vibrio lentus]